jgi:hypothetical protein
MEFGLGGGWLASDYQAAGVRFDPASVRQESGVLMMSQSTLDIDHATLTSIVRRQQQSPDFEVLEWAVTTLSNRGGNVPEGVLRVRGRGYDAGGERSWELALKIIPQPPQDLAPDSLSYAAREWLAYESGVLQRLPGPVVAPRCYGVSHVPGATWLWTEILTDIAGERWALDDYVFAADQLGRFNAACALAGVPSDAPWMARQHVQHWMNVFEFAPAWQDSRVRAVFPAALQPHVERLWADRNSLLDAAGLLPQAFSHFDYKRDNLFLRDRATGQREVVAVDWEICGMGPLGGDLALLIGLSSWQHSWAPGRIGELAATVYPAYIQGMRAAGWHGDEAQIRLAYTTWLATHVGLIIPSCIAWALDGATEYDTQRLFGHPPAALPEGWVNVCAYALDCADEARQLMGW